jgi:hypothetical protein
MIGFAEFVKPKSWGKRELSGGEPFNVDFAEMYPSVMTFRSISLESDGTCLQQMGLRLFLGVVYNLFIV